MGIVFDVGKHFDKPSQVNISSVVREKFVPETGVNKLFVLPFRNVFLTVIF